MGMVLLDKDYSMLWTQFLEWKFQFYNILKSEYFQKSFL